jgi:hypothetical protein
VKTTVFFGGVGRAQEFRAVFFLEKKYGFLRSAALNAPKMGEAGMASRVFSEKG